MLGAFGLYTHIRSNRIKSLIVLGVFPLLLPILVFLFVFAVGAARGHPIGGVASGGLAWAVAVGTVTVPLALVWVPLGYLLSQFIIDRATGARAITRQEETRVWNFLENLCVSRGMKTPALRIIEADGSMPSPAA